jgi:CheY-like chemotaxis protein
MTLIKSILIVDDSFNNLILLEDLLTEMNYEVILAHNGIEAIEKIHESNPDLILLDVMMPKMGGFEMMEKMNELNMDIPVIVITAKNTDEERQKAINLGAVEFIVKPVNISEILDTVEKALSQ